MNIIALNKLMRWRPTIAWSFSGILLGIAVAINEYGLDLNWVLLIQMLIGAFIIQSIVAHALNDLEDEEVDKITDISGTNRHKVLISGLASRKDLFLLSVAGILTTFAIAINLFIQLGYTVLLFYAIGIYSPIAYSVKPLRLGWRPFSEWTVVFPVLVTIVVASNFVATGSLSYLAFYSAIVFALVNITWFLVSRMMDCTPDSACGKMTTPAKYGIKYTVNWLILVLYFVSYFTLILFVVSGYFFFAVSLLYSVITLYIIYRLRLSYFADSTYCAALRVSMIKTSVIHTVLLSLWIALL